MGLETLLYMSFRFQFLIEPLCHAIVALSRYAATGNNDMTQGFNQELKPQRHVKSVSNPLITRKLKVRI